jgi:hypothetical protein
MVNLTRAKDAAMSIAAEYLNLKMAERPVGAPLVSQTPNLDAGPPTTTNAQQATL